jgi:hypothetical protein
MKKSTPSPTRAKKPAAVAPAIMVMVDGFWEDLLEDVSEAASEVAVGDGNASEPRAGIV